MMRGGGGGGGGFRPEVRELVWFPELVIRALVPVRRHRSGLRCCSQCWSLVELHPEHTDAGKTGFSTKVNTSCSLVVQYACF